MTKVMITGIAGMVGSHFAQMYKDVDGVYDVYGLDIKSPGYEKNFFKCDILERDELMRVFDQVKPDIIIHMAAQAYNAISWDCEHLTHMTNIIGSLNVLHCANMLGRIKILLACSSAEYGNITPDDCPLKENLPLRPFTPYGVSKVAMEMMGYQYHVNYDLPVYLPRMFIHVGIGHQPMTAIQNFARQLALIKAGKADPVMRVGNLSTQRDFIDTRDGVTAMNVLVEKGQPGVPYNICNGLSHKISDILHSLIEISNVEVKIEQDEAFMRKADEPLLLGNAERIKSLGYSPKYTIHQTLEYVFDNWVYRVSKGEY